MCYSTTKLLKLRSASTEPLPWSNAAYTGIQITLPCQGEQKAASFAQDMWRRSTVQFAYIVVYPRFRWSKSYHSTSCDEEEAAVQQL